MRDKLFLQCQDGGWLAGFFGADNLRDFSKQLFRRNRRIRGGQSVTLRDEAWIFKIGGRANYAMHEEPFFASIQNDVAGKNVSECASLDEKYVSWPNGREHALPSNLQTQSAEAAQNLCGKLAFQRVLSAVRAGVCVRHETFLLCMQLPCVPWILPHESAEVSKTRSKRNMGFL
jgi:hypothetical protein